MATGDGGAGNTSDDGSAAIDGAASPDGGPIPRVDAGTYSIGGAISGLTGTVVLQADARDSITLTKDGAFTFSQPLRWGATYNVTVVSQPVGESCTVANGMGTVAGDVTDVQVVCAPGEYTIGGTILGASANAPVVLQDNGGDDLALAQSGAFTFAQPLPHGATYAVTVRTAPAGRTCTVQNGGGAIGYANVTDVSISCR